MSISIASYQFHSWARTGISAGITEKDDLGEGTSVLKERASITLPILLNETGLSKNFTLIGPGDIIGINKDMIVRHQPPDRITDFEPNYLAFAELYDPDFLNRYTPGAPDGEKLRPWIFLLIVKDDEFERTKRRMPLTSIMVINKDSFPPANETWLWCHVHNDTNIDDELSDYENFLLSLNSAVVTDPDQLYCRLMSPRKLEANTSYHAFIIPAFETGRLAGLELPTENINAQMPSWDTNGARGEMPVYFEWSFRTGVNEDFESLVKRLQPRTMDPKVGIRDMDCSNPGLNVHATSPAILGLEGALKSPDTVSTVFPKPLDPNLFQSELVHLVNLPIEILGATDSGDPIISIPLYGNKHAKKGPDDVKKLKIEETTWLHDLNKDPRTRVPAGFGTLVIQKNQENYMRKAWTQVQNIIEANKRIKATMLYMNVALQFTKKTFNQVEPNILMSMTRPVLSRIMGSRSTVYQLVRESQLPEVVFSGTFRRLVAPNRNFSKRSADGNRKFQYHKLVEKLNDGSITAAPPVTIAVSVTSIKDIADKIITDKTIAAEFMDPKIQFEKMQSIPARPDFLLKLSGDRISDRTVTRSGTKDSIEARNYRKALEDITKRLALKEKEKIPTPLDISNAYTKIKDAVHPHNTFPKWLSLGISFPDYIEIDKPEKIFLAMAYPDFEDPMYKKLTEISDELLLPNLKLIPNNTISLLKTNPKFIESYMVGLNHEMGRELLWREYPTDERGSYFRQFWDVSGIISPGPDKTPAEKSEEKKDIKPIHEWETNSLLGDHNNRNTQADEQVVLVLRGDLLKKYPNTLIFAQKAVKDETTGEIIVDQDLTDATFIEQVKFPLYRAEIKPDIKFFGFDLTIEQARGTALSDGFPDEFGWYFILMQPPGAPSFGMDINFNEGNVGLSWDDLSWDKFTEEIKCIKKTVPPQIDPDDNNIKWGEDSASMAYILFQKPNMVAVHANEMLASLTS